MTCCVGGWRGSYSGSFLQVLTEASAVLFVPELQVLHNALVLKFHLLKLYLE